jgi:tryptophan halogenase
MADSGIMKAVSSDHGERLEADLFVDCNGFSTTTPGQQSGTEWVDCSQWLMCDREVVMEVDYAHHYSGRIRPYTTATALSAGWVRENPLQSRRSLCYTYSSRYIDEDSASNELRAFEGRHAKSLETRTASFKVGHRLTPWAGNCVSIGAAASSIESLLSTSLYLSELAAIQLAEHFPTGDDMKPFAYRYNRIVTNRFYEILDGINLHYCLTKREDTEFWREVSKPARINDRLKAKLEFWKHKIPSHADFIDQHFPGQPEALLPASDLPGDHRSPIDTGAFLDLEDYESILYGMQFLADECDDWFGPNRPATKVPRYIIRDLQRAPHSLPPHDVLLKSIAGMPDYPVSSGVRR